MRFAMMWWRMCANTWGESRAILVIDEIGFLKKGTQSAGMQRQNICAPQETLFGTLVAVARRR